MNYLEECEERLQVYFIEMVNTLEPGHCFRAPLEYLWSTGGKRLRPKLFLCLNNDLGIKRESFLRIALALEFLHLASLLHDDLPALDNDDYRRGVLTTHKKFSEHTALLLGDWLVGIALRSVLEASGGQQFAYLLSGLWSDICFGQELDMCQDLEKDIKKVHLFKTARFFEVICALIDQESEENLLKTADSYSITRWGADLGMLFQKVDDFLDQVGGPEKTGRPTSSDRRNKKATTYDESMDAGSYRVLKEELKEKLIGIHDKLHFETTLELLDFAFARLNSL